ncbi:MAG: S-adenosylmethionine:tRNA ribosyltransferase-isomerase, partial [Candidatus Omnitrophota bacterium]
MKISDFDYNLPKGLIAQYPCKRRDESRLLVLDRHRGTIEHRIFKDIVEYLHKDDLLLLNDTKVIPARLIGKKETGGKIETLILHRSEGSRSDAEHEVLLKPVRGCNVGSRLIFGKGELRAVVTRIENGRRFLHFERNGDLEKAFERLGEVPLPPYIKRDIEPIDKNRYQTVYASKKGAIA